MKPIALAFLFVGGLSGCTGSHEAEGAVGIYHWPTAADAFNVEIKSDGTFSAKVDGCDYGAEWSGRWTVDGTETVLLPEGDGEHLWREGICPSTCFRWFDEAGAAPVTEVRFSHGAKPGEWDVSFRNEIDRSEVTQVWKEGERPESCSGSEG